MRKPTAVPSNAMPSPSVPSPSVPSLVDVRRMIHTAPELSMKETGTAAAVDGWMRALGLETQRLAGTGVVTMIRGTGAAAPRAGKARRRTILVRADIDGLPVREETSLPFRSANDGVMHACGHDCHVANLVEAARNLVRDPPEGGDAKLLFQPGEEGANGMGQCIDAGLMRRPDVDAAVGVHVFAPVRVGKIGLVRGACMAAVDHVEVEITGFGGHAAYPHRSVDPIVVGAHVVTALQTLVSRRVSPFHQAVVTIGSFQAGTAHNVIPPSARLLGTVRTFDPQVRRDVAREFRRIVASVAKGLGASAKVHYEHFLPATVNDPAMHDLAWSVAEDVVGKRNVEKAEPSMGGEDMSLALEAVPGVFAFVGASDGTRRTSFPHHHPSFDVHEDCLPVGAGFLEAFTRRWLKEAS
ncbi:MAG: putative hydrolase YxeP [Planctomycetes bacterium]|nr:putative hydrolase YxeP [Planctomycetota bacterium]